MMKEQLRRFGVVLGGVVAFSACETSSGPPEGNVTSVRVEPQSVQVVVNETALLEARLRNPAGETVTADERIRWTSEDEVVAGVSVTGVVTGRRAGTTRVAASYRGLSGIANVTVVSGPVASVAVSPSPLEINPGSTALLQAIARDAGGSTVTGRPVSWVSQNASIASVAANGLVTGGLPGETTVTATVDGVTGAATVVVTELPVANVQVTPSSPSLWVGETQRMTATARAESGEIVGGAVMWASSDRAVAEVSADGLVKANAPGTATITATVRGVDGSTLVTVSDAAAGRTDIPSRSAKTSVDHGGSPGVTTFGTESIPSR
jgi:uncharacterized protein YjdB